MNTSKVEAKGRLFFTTDIHGELPTLLHGLKELGFNEVEDTLVCAGDLIDRGRYNLETAMHFLTDQTGAYHTVLGNHDCFCFDTTGYNENYACWLINGGAWALSKINPNSLGEEGIHKLADKMKRLPYAIEVSHKGLTYGVVHAGVPEELSWQEFVASLNDGNTSAKFEATWLRDIVEYRKHYEDNFVKGVDYTIHGHTPVREPTMIANRLHIDTGLVYGKHLTVTEALGEGKFEHHNFNLQEKV